MLPTKMAAGVKRFSGYVSVYLWSVGAKFLG